MTKARFVAIYCAIVLLSMHTWWGQLSMIVVMGVAFLIAVREPDERH